MQQFTTQNAAEMQRRSLATRLERKAAERTALASDFEMPVDELESAKIRVFAQMDHIDELIERCKDPNKFASLIFTKAKLWNLVLPTAGAYKQRQQRRTFTHQVYPLDD